MVYCNGQPLPFHGLAGIKEAIDLASYYLWQSRCRQNSEAAQLTKASVTTTTTLTCSKKAAYLLSDLLLPHSLKQKESKNEEEEEDKEKKEEEVRQHQNFCSCKAFGEVVEQWRDYNECLTRKCGHSVQQWQDMGFLYSTEEDEKEKATERPHKLCLDSGIRGKPGATTTTHYCSTLCNKQTNSRHMS